MKCNNPKCNYEGKITPVDGKGGFEGYLVWQCPQCKATLHTAKKNGIGKPNIKKSMSPTLPDRINQFIEKQSHMPPRSGLVYDHVKHRWVKEPENTEKTPTEPTHGPWNKTKYCKKCGFSENVRGGSQKDIDLVRCPKCGVKLWQKDFSPNF